MKLNCDLGESFGAWKMPVDDQIMQYIDQANIACGFHAGDPRVMSDAISLAITNNVEIGAHPAYPDLQGFGRRSLAMNAADLKACIQYQVAALCGMCESKGVSATYVKPHGALYNDLMQNADIRQTVFQAVAQMNGQLALMIQAHPSADTLRREADKYDVPLIFEVFADRKYTDDGFLMSRQCPGAVLSRDDAIQQIETLISKGTVITESGQALPLQADTICVHGDSPGAIEMAAVMRGMLNDRKASKV